MHSRVKRLLWLVAFAILFAVPAVAADNLRHPELRKFEEEGGKVEFIGHAYGLDGWLLTRKDVSPRTVYTTPEGGLVMGLLVNPEGKLETTEQLLAFKARTEGAQESLPGASLATASAVEKFYAAVEKSNWVVAGNPDAPYIYVFMNVTCDHCQAYWKELQAAVKGGQAQVRLVPFGISPENVETGAAFLSVDNPVAAWQQFIEGNKGALSKDKIKEAGLAALDANTQLLKTWKIAGVPPYTVYRKPADGKVMTVIGRPENTMRVLADLMK